MNPAIELNDITVRYGDVVALDRVSLSLNSGRVCGLVGVNGSGKSTLLNTIVGRVRPQTGTIRLGGIDPSTARRQGMVGYMPQSEQVDWHFPLAVRDVVMTGRYGHLGPMRRARQVDHRVVADALERVELSEYASRQIGQLSGGQRKRVFLARCIAQQASILLLDEPFAGVDKRSEAMITRLLRELAREGACVTVSTHDLQGLPELADEAVLLKNRVLKHAHVEEIISPESLSAAFGLDVLGGKE
ncbi:metal ABC transporter ATP-binding protein [Schaalia sp. ZJ1691]|uniref:metal ABC transporter ATP-binding protein n=1 Tax=Schaalia sp. ZJ1691 TaxID=2709404 RepID=UPI0013EDDB99|nr:metal ABC transporter ATP-binding protein [Schaalia sp. ZJ1691]